MTLAAISRRLRGSAQFGRRDPGPLIGEADSTVSCPACARPLVVGQGRCPGCGSLLVAGVLVKTALFLMLVGSVVGLIGGALLAGAAMAPRLAEADAARAPAPAAPALIMATPVPATAVPPSVVSPRLPQGVSRGILQVASTNDRLSRSAAALSGVLDASPSSAEIAPLLRKVAADARAGRQAAQHLAAWELAGQLASDASALYETAAAAAADGLAAPLADRAAYRAAGHRTRAALDGLAALDSATRGVAVAAGVALPAAP